MALARQQRNPVKQIVGIAIVTVLHIGIIYALVNGIARRVVEVIQQPIVIKIMEEVKPPPPDVPPLVALPMLAAPPPPYIPPPEVHIQTPPQQQNVITAVTNVKPADPTPPLVSQCPRPRLRHPRHPRLLSVLTSRCAFPQSSTPLGPARSPNSHRPRGGLESKAP